MTSRHRRARRAGLVTSPASAAIAAHTAEAVDAAYAALAEVPGVPINPRELRPSQLVQLLNSTPIGEAIRDRQLQRHRARAGLRIGDGRTIDLLRYTAWLIGERHRPKPPPPKRITGYEAIKEQARSRRIALSLSGRNIGGLPRVANPRRKRRAAGDLRFFLETYFRATFDLEFCPDHLKVIARIEQAVLHGGLFAIAMPRGSGKTSLCERAGLWALLYGHRHFFVLISSELGLAIESLKSIKTELETNETLLADFPEVCFPIRCLEGIHQRAAGQLYRGARTRIVITETELVLPVIPRSRAASGIIRVAGVTGRIRGMKYTWPDGQSVRPDLVLVDDPQTDESAHSPSQCAQRERVMAGAILGLAGPGRRISGLAAITVIAPGDLSDRLLDHAKHPAWQGERTKMVYHWPTNEARWQEYVELRRRMQQERPGEQAAVTAECNRFYGAQRAEMDAGAEVAWPQRKEREDLSALQHAYNIRADRGDGAFFAEYQNEPLPDRPTAETLSPDAIARKLSGAPRGQLPAACTQLTGFIDVHEALLYWLVVGWEANFSGCVIDYGVEPDQKAEYFTLSGCRRTLKAAAPRAGLEGAIYAGLERLTDRILAREWRRPDGSVARVERCLIDANWGQMTDLIYRFCRQSRHAAILLPSHGRYVGAAGRPFGEWTMRPGDRTGLNWRIPAKAGKRDVRHVLFDANWWKSFVRDRLAAAMGDPGCLTLFGRQADRHRLLADHLVSEYPIRTEGRGRKVEEWKPRSTTGDNHWWDGLVGAAVAASIGGASIMGAEPVVRRQRVKLSELQRAKRTQREW